MQEYRNLAINLRHAKLASLSSIPQDTKKNYGNCCTFSEPTKQAKSDSHANFQELEKMARTGAEHHQVRLERAVFSMAGCSFTRAKKKVMGDILEKEHIA